MLKFSPILFIIFFYINIFAQSSTLIGSASSDEYAYGICADNNGSIYFGATSNDNAWIFKKDVNNQIVWSKKLNSATLGFSSDISYIDIIGDTIFGCGWVRNGTSIRGSLVFKLNATSGIPYWVKAESTSNTYFSSVKYANGKYFATGSQINNANGYNGKVVAFSSSNGNIIWQTSAIGLTFPGFGIDYIDDFYSTTEMINGKMFITGRSYANGANLDMRTLLIGIDDIGNIFLNKYLEFNTASGISNRFYGISIEYDGLDSLVVLQYGDDNCSTCTNNIAGLIKTDLNGNVSWCKQYNLGGITLEVGRGLNITADSYVLYGYANLNQNNSKMFAIKTNKIGDFLLGKLISLGTGNLGHISGPLNCGGSSNYKNGNHYIPGGYFTTNAGLRDIAQIVLDENLEDPLGCLTLTPVTVTTTSFAPFSDNLNVLNIANTVTYPLNPVPVDLQYISPCNEQVTFVENSTCDSTTITASIQNISNPIFNWSNGTIGNSTTVYNSDTLYISVISPSSCCIITDTIIPIINLSNLSIQLPVDTIFCYDQITPLALTPTSSNNNGTLTYNWNNLEQNDTLFVNQSGTYWVTVSIGCQIASDTIVVTMNQTPLLTNILLDTICNGENTNINLASTIPSTFSWNSSDNIATNGETLATTNATIISDVITNNSTVIQELIYSINLISGICSSSQSLTITVLPSVPTPIITSNGPTSFCSGGTVQLNSSFQFGNVWSTGDTTQIINVSASDTITLVNQINECFSPFTSIIITENTAAIPTASISGGGIFCDGDTINPVIVNFTGNGPWTLDFDINGIPQTPIISSNSTINLGQLSGNYKITNLFDVNCSNFLEDSVLIIINPTPVITVSPISICEGSIGNLTAVPDIVGGSYFWSQNGETTSSINVSPLTTTSFNVIYTLNNCPSATTSGNVVVNSIPILDFAADTLLGCEPLTVNFTNTTLSDPNACIWTLSNGITLNGCNPSYTFTQPGCYDVTLSTSLNACSASSTINNLICVNGFPEALFTGNPLEINIDNSTVNFENLSVNAVSYAWEFGDGNISNLANPSHNFAINEDGYMIVLTAYSEFGCSSTDTLIISYEEDLIFYVPNAFTPDGDQFNQIFKPIFTSGFDPSSYNLTIFDKWGEILFESNDVNIGWDGTYIQSPNIVQDGSYVWKISFKLKKNDERKVYTGHVNVLK